MLSDLTIIIPTYKRTQYLYRILSYYSSFKKFDFTILVLDSSPKNFHKDASFDKFYNKKIIFYNFDPKITFWSKISKSAKFIKTKYCVLIPDDDFLIPKSLNKCVDFLEKNKDYVSAHGYYYNHTLIKTNNKKKFKLFEIYKNNGSSDSNFFSQRIDDYMNGNVNTPYYALYKSEVFKNIWHDVNHYVKDWWIHEIFPILSSFVCGKTKKINFFYASREMNNYSVYTKENLIRGFQDDKVKLCFDGLCETLKKNNIFNDENVAILNNTLNSIKEKNLANAKNLNHKITKSSKRILLSDSLFITFIKKFISLFQRLLLNSCPPKIFLHNYADYLRIKYYVKDYFIDNKEDEINIGRKEFDNFGS